MLLHSAAHRCTVASQQMQRRSKRKRSIASGVSLPVGLRVLADARAQSLGLGFSGYVQAAVEHEVRNKPLQPLPSKSEVAS